MQKLPRLRRRVLALALLAPFEVLVLLSACAATNPWCNLEHSDYGQRQVDADNDQCQRESSRQFGAQDNAVDEVTQCMNARGWYQVNR